MDAFPRFLGFSLVEQYWRNTPDLAWDSIFVLFSCKSHLGWCLYLATSTITSFVVFLTISFYYVDAWPKKIVRSKNKW